MLLLIFLIILNSFRRIVYYYIVLRDIGLRYLVSNLIMVYVLLVLIIYWMLMGKELIWLVESMKFGM